MPDTPTEGSETTSKRRRLTPIDVQQQVFRRSMLRGYSEQEVDDFLDEVTEELSTLLEEQRELRERLQAGVTEPLTGGQDIAEAKRMADDIVRTAREEAAEILRAAHTEAAATAGGAGADLQPFISQERAFLQDLSRLIQGHADSVRDMARARKESATSSEVTRVPEVTEQPSAEPGPGDLAREEASAQSGSVKELFYGEES